MRSKALDGMGAYEGSEHEGRRAELELRCSRCNVLGFCGRDLSRGEGR